MKGTMKHNQDNNRYSKNLIFGEVSATKGAYSQRSLYQIYGISAARANLVRQAYNESKFKFWWYFVFIIAGIVCLFTIDGSWLNVIELFVCMIAIDLIGRANIWGQGVQIIECLLYGYISFTNGLYGEVFKSVVINLALAIFAIVSWSKNMKQGSTSKELTVKKLSVKGWIISGGSFVVIGVTSYFVLGAFNTTALVLSAITLAISIVSKTLNALCFKESWFLTILQACINLCLWCNVLILSATSGAVDLTNLPILFVYLAILTNAIYSFILWKVMYKKVAINGAQIFAKRPLKINKIIKLRKRFKTLKWDKEIDEAKNNKLSWQLLATCVKFN